MSERNPADDEDSGYSRNQTESLPTSGSVPDLSGTETSAVKKYVTLKKCNKDSVLIYALKPPPKLKSGSPRKRSLPSVSPRSMTPEARSWLMEKEVLESQTRKLQMEVSSLSTENKILRQRLDRAQVTMEDLEGRLSNNREEVDSVYLSLQQQQREAERHAHNERTEEYRHLQSQIERLSQENLDLKSEVSKFEKHLDAAEKASNQVRLSSEKAKTMEAYKMEIITLREEVGKVKALLNQSEHHLGEEEGRNRELNQQVVRLTEMKNLLQQQIDKGGGGTVSDKQIKSLEKRLKITEERLHQERADRANNLSEVEDKLLTENARLQAVEKELNRQLQREKDKNRNLDTKVKDGREEVERLRLALPFDESTLTADKSEEYDIPYSKHSNHRLENKKTPDYKYVMGQVEQQSGLTIGQEKEVICHLWSTREMTYQQLRHLQFTLQDLELPDNDISAGLKHLRDIKGQYESRLQQLEEKLSDSQSQLATYETTYKEQLNTLVRERHDSFARLKTTEDLLEALKGENEILKSNFPGTMGTRNTNARDSQMDDLKVKLKNLENELHHLQTRNQVLDGEVQTLRVQLEAKEKALEDALTEADLASSRLNNTDAMDRKQERIQKLQYEIQNLQTEIRVLSEKNNFLSEEKKRSDTDLSNCQRELGVLRSRQREGSAGDLADNKYVQSLQEELQQKEVQLSQSTRDLQTVEKELKQTRQAMYSEQAQIAHLQTQVDSLRDQMEQKNLILDSLDGNESDSQSHYSSLKETLESMSQELALLRAQNKTLQTEVNRERSRCEILKEEVSRTSVHSEPRDRTELELQIQQLEEERDRLQEELIETARSGEELTHSVIESQSETQKLQQDLSSEQAKLLHMSAQKGELEQHLEEIAEEHDALIQEKSQNEEDIVKLEGKLQELVQTLELETQRHHDDHQSLYGDTTPELRKMARELDSIRILLDAKAREMEMLQDKLSRQNMETEFLQRRVELLHSENQCNREDIARLTTELASKIKESSSLKEVNQILSRERGQIQRQREMEDKEKAREREHSEKYRKEVSEVIHKADVQKYQRECAELREQLQRVTVELETVRAQLSARDETVENLKQDKGAFYQEYDSMCRRLAEKDEKIEQLQQRYDRTVDNMKQEFSQQKHNLEQERTSAESDLDKAKDTINYLNEEIKQKDAQLVTFGRTLHELEEASRKKHELEQQVETLEHDCSSVKQLMQSHQREIESHQSTISRMQEVQAKLQVEKTRLADQLREEKDSSGREIELLRKSLSDMESLHEGEKAYLKENQSQTQSRLQAVETSLASAVEARDKYQMTNRMLEHSLEENRSKLQEESTCYRAAEKKTESLQSQLNDSRRERFLTEDKLSQCQTSLVNLEKELGAERERCQDLEERIQELEAVSATQQSTLRAKQEQVDVLQSEIGKLRQIIDGQKQQLGGKLKKSAQEFKQQLDLVEMEKDQLSKQNKQLTFDLEKARETIQTKNKDNLKLQEDILNLEEQIRERSSKLRKIEDNLKVEEEIQSKLASRYQEQEDEVKRMKNFLSKKAEEATDADKSMWQDMSKVIQDMSLKIAQHFEGAKERENQREQDLKQIKRYKKQVRDLESELSTERAVHSITRSSLQALEEDCLRLRKQFMASKRRDKSSPDKPSKSRMEAINEIIARSQTQAQNMLAAGGYFEETLRSITTPRGANNNYNDCSPDTSIASDFSFNSVSPVVMATYPSQAKSPRK
uniref:Myosin-10-like isoform X4 n=1 Tax=Crassostrea virginica TaxID=6565 RepID=A0A8B8DVE8_CRAVI|nr:myosin-10-like isoform X4 [Crassostrea virginica]